MKKAITILTILICSSSYGQMDKLNGTWISSEQDFISFGGKDDNYISSKIFEVDYLKLLIHRDTLKFEKKYSRLGKEYTDPYCFKIISISDSSLIIEPASSFSKNYSLSKPFIKFTRQEYAVDTTIIFQKIIFHSSKECCIFCPRIDLEIDNKKNIYFDGEFENYSNYEIDTINSGQFIDTISSGQFIGVLSDNLYNELIQNLQTCNLKTLDFKYYYDLHDMVVDGSPEITIIVYFNGERKFLRSNNPPKIADKLIRYLHFLNTRMKLTRTKEKRKLEENLRPTAN